MQFLICDAAKNIYKSMVSQTLKIHRIKRINRCGLNIVLIEFIGILPFVNTAVFTQPSSSFYNDKIFLNEKSFI